MNINFFRSVIAGTALALMLPLVAYAQSKSALDKRMDEFHAAKKAGDVAASRTILDELVAKGHPSALYEQGEAYRLGDGVEKNGPMALKLHEQAANANDILAMRMVGWMHEKGDGVPADAVKALAAYRRSADKGDAWSFTQIGYLYWNGEGTPANGQEAVRWWMKGADARHVFSMNALAQAYTMGRADVPKNADQAHFWSVRAMAHGHEGAKKRLYEAGFRSPVEVLGAFNRIVQNSGGRLRVANFEDEGNNGGTFSLYRTADGSAGGNVIWMMDFGVALTPELRTKIGARVRKSSDPTWLEGRQWRERILAELKLGALDAAVGEWNTDLKP